MKLLKNHFLLNNTAELKLKIQGHLAGRPYIIHKEVLLALKTSYNRK